MKKRMMMIAALVLAGWTAFGEKGTYSINLANFGEMGFAVRDVELQITDYGITTTNRWTPEKGALVTSSLRDSVVLKANLMPGYCNAEFQYYTSINGRQTTPITGFISNDGAIPFYTAPGVSGGTVPLITFVTNLTYEAMTFTLSFNSPGGSVTPSWKTITYDQPYGDFPVPQREGYDFQGWWGDGREWDGTETVRTLTNQTFTAQWEPIHYRVHFEPGEGGTGTMTDQEFVYDQAQRLTPCAFTRANYVFDCWSNTVSGVTYRNNAEVENLTTNEVLTLVALWSAKQYSIRYYRNYNISSETPKTSGITYGESTKLEGEYTRSGYMFSGWARSRTAPIPEWGADETVSTLDFEFDENGVLDLYAVWEPITYTVQFFPNGGSGTMQEMFRTFDDGEKLSACTFTNPGYTFAGWAKSATGPIVWAAESNENLTSRNGGDPVRLYAVWAPISYSVSFAANKGVGEMESLSLSYGVLVKLPACAFEKDGYEFIGWARTADGEVEFADRAQVGNLTVVAGDDVVLFARWKAESYYVTLNANGGVFGVAETGPTTSNILVTVDEPWGDFPVATNRTPKLVFGDWRTPPGDVVRSTDTVPPPSAGVTNLVAHWVKDDPLANAVDAEELDFDWSATRGSGQWGRVDDETAENGASACATINPGVEIETVRLTTKVVGPGRLTFRWKVLSNSEPWPSESTAEIWEMTAERLYFQLGPALKYGIVGTSSYLCRFSDFSDLLPTTIQTLTTSPDDWQEETLHVDARPGETNTLTWTFSYLKDAPVAGRAWVDYVRWVPEVVIPIDWNDDLNNLHSGDVVVLSAAEAAKLPEGAEIVVGEPPKGWKLDGDLKEGADGSLLVTLALDEGVLTPQGADGAAPLTIESTAEGKLRVKASIANGVRGFWYSFYTADELTGSWNVVTTGSETGEAVKQATFDGATGEFSISILVDPRETKRFYKLVVTEQDPRVVHLPSN